MTSGSLPDGRHSGGYPARASHAPQPVSQRPTEPGNATTDTRTIRTIVLEQGIFEGARLNTSTMSDFQTLAATILANFTTVRIPRRENLWISAVPNPSPKHLHRLRSRARTGRSSRIVDQIWQAADREAEG